MYDKKKNDIINRNLCLQHNIVAFRHRIRAAGVSITFESPYAFIGSMIKLTNLYLGFKNLICV